MSDIKEPMEPLSLFGKKGLVIGIANEHSIAYGFARVMSDWSAAMTVTYAWQQHWPLEKVEVCLSHRKVNKIDTFEKKVIVHGDALTQEQCKKLVDIAAKCPIQRTLQSDVVIRTLAE